MNIKFLKAACLGMVMMVCSNANAGLITGTNVEVDTKSISYIEFLLTATGEINWSMTGLPDGTDPWANSSYHFALLEGSFGAFGSLLVLDQTNGLIKELTETLDSGTYTFAVGTYTMNESEARSGVASTPVKGTQLFNFSLSGDTLVSNQLQTPIPEPTTLAIFALAIAGLASRRIKKQS
jgi:hypothetical protein